MSQNISSAVFVPGDHWLVTSDPEHVRLWNMNQLAAWPKLLSGHTGQVTTADFSPGGNWLATGSTDVTVKLWNMLVPGFFSLSLGGFTDRIGGVSFSTDGKWLATGSGDTIALWQMDTVGSDPKPTNSWEITDQNSGGDIKSLAINHKDSLIALGFAELDTTHRCTRR
ncbi:MAG: hypothetical protein H6647_11210 [Anaerolineales bacterium]|nr:hypothetical protein [Anaerolineales bacterium]